MRPLTLLVFLLTATLAQAAPEHPTLRDKVLCGYQGWFRAPGDASGFGWTHWSRDSAKLTAETATFEMWPDTSELLPEERHPTPAFTGPDSQPMSLFSSDNLATVRRHFHWMEQYGLDGVWLQMFAVELPGGPAQERYESRRRVLEHVRIASRETGRAWAVTFDLTGVPGDKVFDIVANEWQQLVLSGVTRDAHYIYENGKPVVHLFGFYPNNAHNQITAAQADRLVILMKSAGPGQAYVVGGGEWNWRQNPDPQWQAVYAKLDAISPWNVANWSPISKEGGKRASWGSWKDDLALCQSRGQLWIPVVYPGFAWSNLKKLAPGEGRIPRRGGEFLWEQFHQLSTLGVRCANVAMFDEVDEGTAIFKVTNTPPREGHWETYEGKPSDWYLRLVGEATKRLRAGEPLPQELPLQ